MIELYLPIRTVSEANAREHWAAKAHRAAAQRGSARLLLLGAGRRWPTKPTAIALTRIGPRDLDDDNLARSLKAVRDGIADALGISDGDTAIAWTYSQRRGRRTKLGHEYAVEVSIR